jgi:hemerythrin superfamily protein
VADAIALLQQDHRAVEKLFDRFEKTGDAEIARRICQELRLHSTIEEDLVYPVLEQLDSGLARQSRDDHRETKQLVDRIERLRVADGGLRALVEQLKMAVLEHVAEEETTVLPKMQANLDDDRLSALGDELSRRRGSTLSDLEAEIKKLRTGVNRLSRVARQAISEDLETMTKAELQAYAVDADIADVDQDRQTKEEMIDAIRAELGS